MYRRQCISLIAAIFALLSSSCSPEYISELRSAVNSLSPTSSRAIKKGVPIPANVLARYQQIPDAEVWFAELYEQRNFDKIEAFILQSLEKDHEDELASGYLIRLYGTLGGLPNRDYHHTSEDAQAFKKQKAVLDQWISERPQSHIPWLIRGSLLTTYGWEHRRDTYYVNRSAGAEFKRYLQQAKADLERSTALNPQDPNSWDHLILIAKGLSLPENQMNHYYQQGLLASLHHLGVRTSRLSALYPWWGGSWEEALAFAKASHEDAVADDKPMLGITLLVAAREIGHQSRKRTGDVPNQVIDWSEMQAVYQRIFAKYPDNLRMRYYYADDANQHQHYAEALEQFEIIGDRWTTGTSWSDKEEFHRVRANTYAQVAHKIYEQGFQQFQQGNQQQANALAEKSEQLALKSVEFWPQARTYLLLASLSGNVDQDFVQVVSYAQQAIASTPTDAERKYAQDMIHKAQQLQGQ